MNQRQQLPNQDFDTTARNIAESIDTIMGAERTQARRLDLIRRQIRHAMNVAFRAGIARGSGRGPPPENETRRRAPAGNSVLGKTYRHQPTKEEGRG